MRKCNTGNALDATRCVALASRCISTFYITYVQWWSMWTCMF